MASAIRENGSNARVILQQCLSAKLQVQPATDNNSAEFVQIHKGLVIYVCFLKGASLEIVDKMAKAVLTIKLSETDRGKRVSILELPGDVLIVPQATLGGRPKGKVMQYHSNTDKSTGYELYSKFVEICRSTIDDNPASKERNCILRYGTYGNRQVLQIDTNGPYTHILEF